MSNRELSPPHRQNQVRVLKQPHQSISLYLFSCTPVSPICISTIVWRGIYTWQYWFLSRFDLRIPKGFNEEFKTNNNVTSKHRFACHVRWNSGINSCSIPGPMSYLHLFSSRVHFKQRKNIMVEYPIRLGPIISGLGHVKPLTVCLVMWSILIRKLQVKSG